MAIVTNIIFMKIQVCLLLPIPNLQGATIPLSAQANLKGSPALRCLTLRTIGMV